MKYRKLTDDELNTFLKMYDSLDSLREDIIQNLYGIYAAKYRLYIMEYYNKGAIFRHFHKKMKFNKFMENFSVHYGWCRTYVVRKAWEEEKLVVSESYSDFNIKGYFERKFNVPRFDNPNVISNAAGLCNARTVNDKHNGTYKKFVYKMKTYAEQPIEFDDADIELYDEIIQTYTKMENVLNELKTIIR